MNLPDRIRDMPPHWAGETIRPFDEDLFRDSLPFVRRRYWCDSGSVNVFRIVGTTHASYQNKTWDWMIKNAKKISSNLKEYEWNPDYYLQTTKKGDISFVTFDGLDYYIMQGNHRSTIARFDFHYRGLTTLHGVSIEDVRIDWPMFECFQRILAHLEERHLPYQVATLSEKLTREDTAGWMLETFLPRIRIRGMGTEIFLENVSQAEQWLNTLPEADSGRKSSRKTGIFARFLGKGT